MIPLKRHRRLLTDDVEFRCSDRLSAAVTRLTRVHGSVLWRQLAYLQRTPAIYLRQDIVLWRWAQCVIIAIPGDFRCGSSGHVTLHYILRTRSDVTWLQLLRKRRCYDTLTRFCRSNRYVTHRVRLLHPVMCVMSCWLKSIVIGF